MVLAVQCFPWWPLSCRCSHAPSEYPGHWHVPTYSLKISKLMHWGQLDSGRCSQGANSVPTATAFASYSPGVWGHPCWLSLLPMAAPARCQWLMSLCRAEVVLGNIIKKKGWR